jgi:hypothetical protein
MQPTTGIAGKKADCPSEEQGLPKKKAYQPPQIELLGSLCDLLAKTGANIDNPVMHLTRP